MMQRGQSRPRSRSRQFGYPLSFRGQVRGAQGLLPCFPPTALVPWRLPSLARVLASPVPRGHRYDEGATTSRSRILGRLFVSRPRSTRSSSFVLASSALPGGGGPIQAGTLVQPAVPLPARSHVDANGISQVPRRSIPCLCPGPRPRPDRRRLTMPAPPILPPQEPLRRLQRRLISRLLTRLQHLLPTLRERRCRRPGKAHFRLAGWPLPGGS